MNKHTDPITRIKMIENADFFEGKAIDVQDAAEEDDRRLALQSVDCQMKLFWGSSLLDIAVKSKSNRFVETPSCKQAIQYRLYGDLDPVENSESWTAQLKLFAASLSLGLLPAFSDVVKFTPPPNSTGFRRMTQRRRIPKGYPDSPSVNPILKRLKKNVRKNGKKDIYHVDISSRGVIWVNKKLRKLLELDDYRAAELTVAEQDILWSPTFSAWERWTCFMTAPCTIFLFNGMITFLITVWMSFWFVLVKRDPNRMRQIILDFDFGSFDLDPFFLFRPDDSDFSLQTQFTYDEWVWLIYFSCTSIRELVQLYMATKQKGWVDGLLKDYLMDFWNICDILGSVLFMLGFSSRYRCIDDKATCYLASFRLRNFSPKEEEIFANLTSSGDWNALPWDLKVETWSLCYSMCLWFCWFRVLHIFFLSDIGYIVSIFACMFKDVWNWVVVYCILLLAFSMLFLGASDYLSLVPGAETCSSGFGERFPDSSTHITQAETWSVPDDGWAACHWSFIFVRPMFQSFGEFSLSEMKNAPSLIFLILTYLMMNLVLMNLLIAMMAGTFTKNEQAADRSRLLHTYDLAEEHSRVSIAYPPPFNIFLLVYDFFGFWWKFKELKAYFPDCTFSQRIELYLSGAFKPDSLSRHDEIGGEDNHCFTWSLVSFSICPPRLPAFKDLCWPFRSKDSGSPSHQKQKHSSDHNDIDAVCQTRLSAFMERARSEVVNKVHPKDTLEGKVESIQDEVKHVHTMQETIRFHQVQSRSGSGAGEGKIQSYESQFEGRRKANVAQIRDKVARVALTVGKKATTVKRGFGYARGYNDDLLPNFFQNRPFAEGGKEDVREHENDREDEPNDLEQTGNIGVQYAVCGYLTDVEANFDYFERYLKISQIIGWSDEDSSFVPQLKKLEFKREDAIFVYGGDTQDKGIGDIRFTKLLLELRENNPGRVEFIIGNRDANKLRLATELHEDAIKDPKVLIDKSFPYWENEDKRCTPQMFLDQNKAENGGSENTAANRLRWILDKNMGAGGAFERRRHELSILRVCETTDISDDDVVASYRDEIDPRKHPGLKWEVVGREEPNSRKLIENRILSAKLQEGQLVFSADEYDALGLPSDLSYISYNRYIQAGDTFFKPAKQHGNNFMLQFLKEAKLAYVFGANLFVHGAINAENQGTVPGAEEVLNEVHEWVDALNAWAQEQVHDFEANPFYHAESTDDCSGLYTDRKGGDLMDYGVPNGNEGKTVVYNNFLDPSKKNNAKHIAREVQEFLTASQIKNVVSGHQPHGDCPCVIRTGPVTVITADTSYSEMGHKSEWGTDNRGVNAISEVLLYADGTSEVHGFLADGSPISYKLGVAGDDYVGHQLGNGYWVKAKIVGPEPEYLLAMMQGFAYLTERKRGWELDGLTAAHFNIQQCHDIGLAQVGIDTAFHGMLINAGLDIETLRLAADDRRYLDSVLEKAGIRRPGDRVRIVKAVMEPNP